MIWIHLAAAALLASAAAAPQPLYRKPPQAILEAFNAPATPLVSVSPSREWILLRTSPPYPPVAGLAQPMLRLAGLRIDPGTNGPHAVSGAVDLRLQHIASGRQVKVDLPASPRISLFEWSPDSRHFAFLHTTATGTELWTGDTATGATRKVPRVSVNAVLGTPARWLRDSRTLLVYTVPPRTRPPAAPAVPLGPRVQESVGKKSGTGTFEDLLKNPHDEDLFDYYATAQLAIVEPATGRIAPLGRPGIFATVSPAPDGVHLLVSRIHRPYSYTYRYTAFPKEVEVWNFAGRVVHRLASLPLMDDLGLGATPPGPRNHAWKPGEPATVVWMHSIRRDEENGESGEERKGARDRILLLRAPFTGEPVELARTPEHCSQVQWTEDGKTAFVHQSNRARHWTRVLVLDATNPAAAPREIFSRNTRDAYKNPGAFVLAPRRGQSAVLQHGGFVYLTGNGASPEGDRPFLDRLDLKTLQTGRLFRSEADCLESVVALLAPDASRYLTRRESPTGPPNYFVRTAGTAAARALTRFPDPAPVLRKITRQLVTYKRADGVQLSFTLYLPPGYEPGTRLPAILWAYPREFDDPDTAGQVVGSPQRFTSVRGASHLFLALHGYAILDGATMPVVGQGDKANDTYVEQIVSSARAAIEKAAQMGVIDPQRVGVGGHSYGAFMTANLLARSTLFRAGVARSGAYNRTLTPFGFQSERRTLWKARDVYLNMSPFLYAGGIKAPLLLIHGEADDNMGTFPIQSERMYEAVRGNGGITRLVMLPNEAHTYRARESLEHVLYEMAAWFDRYVKDARP